jgi:hypothetical protein
MFILVQHTISDPATTWARAQESLPTMPAHLKLHHSFPAPEGNVAVCIWEAESVDVLKSYLDPMLGPSAKNAYTEVVNKEGVGVPTAVQTV